MVSHYSTDMKINEREKKNENAPLSVVSLLLVAQLPFFFGEVVSEVCSLEEKRIKFLDKILQMSLSCDSHQHLVLLLQSKNKQTTASSQHIRTTSTFIFREND